MDSKQIIDTYYQGWAKRDKTQTRSVMADNMSHASPEGQFLDADTFLSECWVLGKGLTGVDYEKSIYTEDEAFVILDWQAESGSFLSAEYVRLENGKIREVLVINNTTSLAEAMR